MYSIPVLSCTRGKSVIVGALAHEELKDAAKRAQREDTRLLLSLSARSDPHGGTDAHDHSEQLIKSLWRWSPTKLAPRHTRAGVHAATAANDAAATAAADAPSHNTYGAAASFTHVSDAASATATCFCIHHATTVAVRITIQVQETRQGI